MLRLKDVFQRIEHLTTIYATVCVVILMVCVAMTAQALMTRLSPAWNLSFLPVLAGIMSVEAMLSQRRMRRTADLNTSVVIYRMIEWLVILTIIKLVSIMWQPDYNLVQVLASWETHFISNFFDGLYLVSLLVVGIVWGISTLFAEDLIDLEGDEMVLDTDSFQGLVSDRAAAQRHLTSRVFTIGGIMVFIHGLLRQDVVSIFDHPPLRASGVGHVVTYFIVGLILLSLTQLANRRLAWAWEHIPVKEGIAPRWFGYSLLFLLFVVMLALMLPTGYTIGFMPVLSVIFGTILYLLFGLLMLILTPFFFVISWILSLFKVVNNIQPPSLAPLQELVPLQIASQTGQPAWLELLKSILFWVVLLSLIGVALAMYFYQNKEFISKVKRTAIWKWLIDGWKWLRGRLQAGVGLADGVVQGGWDRIKMAIRRRRGLRSARLPIFHQLDPRQKVIFYYHALLHRASEADLPRAAWQTPHEYEEVLHTNFSEMEIEIGTLTDGFEAAQYSQHPVDEKQVTHIRDAWSRLRSFLRDRMRGRSDE